MNRAFSLVEPKRSEVPAKAGIHLQQAFSLVELSIVLVILGLLTGGILAGQSLIRASELRAVSTESSRYLTAAQTFRDKYFAIPGDMSNATKFWGDDNDVCPDAAVTNGTPGTCNGNSDGYVREPGTTNEMMRFWQHLALTGLLEGSYSGVEGSVGNWYDATAGVNVPKSKLNNAQCLSAILAIASVMLKCLMEATAIL